MPERQSPLNRADDAPSRRHALALAAMTGGGVALLAALVARLDADEQWQVDARVRELVTKHQAPALRTVLRAVGWTGTVAVYAPVAGMTMAWLSRRHGVRRALPIGAAVGGAVVLGFLLKSVVQRPRPTGARGPTSSHPSFPSGHAARATALVGILGYVAVRERLAAPEVAVPLATSIALAVGVSRAYADAHWTTDIVAGWATGIMAGAVGSLAYEHARAPGMG